MNQINVLEKKYKSKELQKHIELLYKELDNKMKKLENSSEFKSAEAKLNSFISENELMEESTLYFLTKEDENKEFENGFDNDSLNAFEDSVNCITIPEDDSLVVDSVIQKVENTYKSNCNVFWEYKQLFERLLENEDYILFSCIWDEPGEMFVDKEVNINDMKIEDLASIEFNKILKI